ncbi:hypothetical protein SKAU_G00400270 [Synaphobranchus kaupii]|uniref:Uncharacterized protein n=1 Tax=Synaphobranchus kaupii TaxID=118154 RepID=A0A9Q1E8Z5_SYNKA|nr:hypothetical protein SKAU_G00400270 [Synaphobranchus kaupii]
MYGRFLSWPWNGRDLPWGMASKSTMGPSGLGSALRIIDRWVGTVARARGVCPLTSTMGFAFRFGYGAGPHQVAKQFVGS